MSSRAEAQISAYLNFPTDASGAIPALLSQTGAFSDAESLSAIPGLQPYDVNQPLWSDGAEKFRWAGIPSGTRVTFSATGKWVFPAGSVLVKHFELGAERRRVETRFEIIKPGGGAYFLTYRWRADHGDADLVAAAGLTETLTLADGSRQKWSYPSRILCTACHNDAANPLLGPNTRQLNRPAEASGENQLAAWNALGLFAPTIDPSAIANYDALANISDRSATLELRVRSYLDTNCAVCHNPDHSIATAARFDARFNTPIAQSGIVNGPVVLPLGISGARVIKAQDPGASIAFHRLSSNDSELRMPPVGRSVVHQEARELILRWLLTLDPIASLDAPGYLSRWAFDGSLADETGTNPAVHSGIAEYADGIDDLAIELSGNGDHIDVGVFDLPGTQMTISLWIRIDDLATTTPFIAKANGPSEGDTVWSIGQASGGSASFQLKTDGSTTTLLSPAGTLTEQQWIHVGAIYDGATMRLYRDGSEVASAAKTGTINSDPGAGVAIGWQPASGSPTSFVGRLDDLRLYHRALRASELDAARLAALNHNTAPIATVDQPGSTRFVLAGQSVTFSGSASDAEDGVLSASGTWYSSLDGALGSGTSITPPQLSAGEHLIVFTANDSQRVAASASREVTVVPGLAGYLKSFGLSGAAASPLADPDADGLAQLQEYAFHLDPTAPQPTPVRASGSGIEFPISKKAIDLEFIVQSSVDLQTWIDGTVYRPGGDSVDRTSGGAMQQVAREDNGTTVTITESAANQGRHYLRILVQER